MMAYSDALRLDQVLDRFEQAWQNGERPIIEDWLNEVPPDQAAALLKELIVVEVELRRCAGEPIGSAEYLERFPDERTIAAEGFRRGTESWTRSSQTRVAVAHVFHHKERRFSINLVAPIEFGRQRRGEPPPFCMTPSEQHLRVIIAPSEKRNVSRRHVQIQLVTEEDRIQVESLTSRRDILVQGQLLEPQDNALVDLPALVVIGSYAIRVDGP